MLTRPRSEEDREDQREFEDEKAKVRERDPHVRVKDPVKRRRLTEAWESAQDKPLMISVDREGHRIWAEAVDVRDGFRGRYRIGDATDEPQFVGDWVFVDGVFESAVEARTKALEAAKKQVASRAP